MFLLVFFSTLCILLTLNFLFLIFFFALRVCITHFGSKLFIRFSKNYDHFELLLFWDGVRCLSDNIFFFSKLCYTQTTNTLFDLSSWFLVSGSWFSVLGSWFLVLGSFKEIRTVNEFLGYFWPSFQAFFPRRKRCHHTFSLHLFPTHSYVPTSFIIFSWLSFPTPPYVRYFPISLTTPLLHSWFSYFL